MARKQTLTDEEINALNSWESINGYLSLDRQKPLTAIQLQKMLNWEMKNKQRVNVITRLNNKIFEIQRNEALNKLLRIRIDGKN